MKDKKTDGNKVNTEITPTEEVIGKCERNMGIKNLTSVVGKKTSCMQQAAIIIFTLEGHVIRQRI